MARAKRTDRTEARRRHRAEQATVTSGGAAVATAGATAGSATGGGATATVPKTAQPAQLQRPSLTAALRAAFRPVDFVGDLKALPRILVHW